MKSLVKTFAILLVPVGKAVAANTGVHGKRQLSLYLTVELYTRISVEKYTT